MESVKRFESKASGHPEYNFQAKSIETNTGPIGQGIANAVGMAMSEKMLSAKYGDEIFNHYTYAICEYKKVLDNTSREAMKFAADQKLNKLIYLWGITIDGKTSVNTSEDNKRRFMDAGWHVQEVDGHSVDKIKAAIAKAKTTAKPSIIVCRTNIGFGREGAGLGAKEIEDAKKNFKWEAEPFHIPDDILRNWDAIGYKYFDKYKQWKDKFHKSEHIKEILRIEDQVLPADYDKKLNSLLDTVLEDKPGYPSRLSSELVLHQLA